MRRLIYSNIWLLFAVAVAILCFTWDGLGQKTTESQLEVPVQVSPCQLAGEPGTYNHKLIEITSFVSHGFEDFTLFDPGCSSRFAVWLEYGGKAVSGTMYCCGVTTARTRAKPLIVEGIPVSLMDDAQFRQFDNVIHTTPDTILHAKILGRFFSGREPTKGNPFRGYGHMGCCSLLAIQQIVSVDPQNRSDLDYRASPDQPNRDNYKFLTPVSSYGPEIIAAEQKAEAGGREWAFNDHKRVAVDGLAGLLKIDPSTVKNMTMTRQAQGQYVYEWRDRKNRKAYMVVISRPYWLSFFARDSQKVAWVVAAAYESDY